jgi:hypothetical protein
VRPRGSNAAFDDSEIDSEIDSEMDSEIPPDRRAGPRANDAASVRIHWVHTYLKKEAIRSLQRPSTINVEAISVVTSIGSTRTACGASASCAST